jgi:hypothetical protein
MMAHNITYTPMSNVDVPILVRCTCGVILPAHSGTDAVRVAKVHIEGEKLKEASDAITT